MQLQQVNRIRVQVPQTAFDPRRVVGAAVRPGRLREADGVRLSWRCKFFLPLFFQFRQQPFAAAVAINVRRIKKIHACIQCRMEGRERFLVIHTAPRAADGPRAKTDFRNLPAGPSECAMAGRFRRTIGMRK